MISGVNFQPGQQSNGTETRPKQGNSVQEAIKILSLRLPKQVGPNALAPAALLNAQGSGGNPRVDSVVNTVMSRMFPTGDAPGGAPVLGPSQGENGTMPVSPPVRFDGNTRPADTSRLSSLMPTSDPRPAGNQSPNIKFENPAAPNMDPPEWATPPPGPPPGFDGNIPRFDGPLTGAPTQDPWADLVELLRRNQVPTIPEQLPSI